MFFSEGLQRQQLEYVTHSGNTWKLCYRTQTQSK